MRAASMRPVSGPAATDALAASSGLDVPGDDPVASAKVRVRTVARIPEPIPGERDPQNLTRREPGSIGTAFGAGMPSPDQHEWLDAAGAHDRMLEGGGEDHKHHNTEEYPEREAGSHGTEERP